MILMCQGLYQVISHVLTHLIHLTTLLAKYYCISVLQMGKLRRGGVW